MVLMHVIGNIRGDIYVFVFPRVVLTLQLTDIAVVTASPPSSSRRQQQGLPLSGWAALPVFLTHMTQCGKWDRRRSARAGLVVYVVKMEH